MAAVFWGTGEECGLFAWQTLFLRGLAIYWGVTWWEEFLEGAGVREGLELPLPLILFNLTCFRK